VLIVAQLKTYVTHMCGNQYFFWNEHSDHRSIA
jgi:hypothetical protein